MSPRSKGELSCTHPAPSPSFNLSDVLTHSFSFQPLPSSHSSLSICHPFHSNHLRVSLSLRSNHGSSCLSLDPRQSGQSCNNATSTQNPLYLLQSSANTSSHFCRNSLSMLLSRCFCSSLRCTYPAVYPDTFESEQ